MLLMYVKRQDFVSLTCFPYFPVGFMSEDQYTDWRWFWDLYF